MAEFLKWLQNEILNAVGFEWAEIIGPAKIAGMVVGLIVVLLLVWRFRARRWLKWVLATAVIAGAIVLAILANPLWLLVLTPTFGLVFWIVSSIRVVGPGERAVLVRLGQPLAIKESGLCLAFWGLDELVSYPKMIIDLDYEARPALTAAGTYQGETHGRAEILVDTSVYFDLTESDLLLVIQFLPSPDSTEGEDVKKWVKGLFELFEDLVVGTTRAVCGRITWAEAADHRDQVSQSIQARLRQSDSLFLRAGISNVSTVIEEIQLPRELEERIIRPEAAGLERRAGEEAARLGRVEVREIGEGYRELGRLGQLLAPVFALLDRRGK